MNQKLTISIVHETFGELLYDEYDGTDNKTREQFVLVLKMIQNCLANKMDYDTYETHRDFLLHIPYKNLRECIIRTHNREYTLSDHLKTKVSQETTT